MKMKNRTTKKFLTATAATAAMTAGVVAVNITNVHASTSGRGTSSTNDTLSQAQQNVQAKQTDFNSASQANDQAAKAMSDAQQNVNVASQEVSNAQSIADQASQKAQADSQAVSAASDAVQQTSDKVNVASEAASNRGRAEADLKQAKSDQSLVSAENADDHLQSAVDNAQTQVNQASNAKQTAEQAHSAAQDELKAAQDKLNNAGSVSQTTQADVDAANQAVNDAQAKKKIADQHAGLIKSTEDTLNQGKEKLSEINNQIDSINQQINNSDSVTTSEQYEKGKRALQATVQLPQDFYDIANSMVDMSLNDFARDDGVNRYPGASWADNFPDYAHALIKATKQSQANFRDKMYDILMDYDPTAYDTVVDISSGKLDGTTMAKLTQFAADVLNVYRHNLGEQDIKVNAVWIAQTLNDLDKDDGTNYAEDYAKSLGIPLSKLLSLSNELKFTTKNETDHANSATDIESNKVEAEAYPVMGHPHEYTMDQLYLSVYVQITSVIATDGVLPSETDKFDTIHAGWDGAPNHVMMTGLIDDNQFDTPQTIKERIYPSDTSVAYVYYWLKNDDFPTMVSYRTTTKNSEVENYYYNPLVTADFNDSHDDANIQKHLNDLKNDKLAQNAKVQQLKLQLSQLNEQYPDAKKVADDAAIALTKAQEKLNEVKAAFNEAQDHISEVVKLQQAIKTAQDKVTQTQSALDQAKDNVQSAQSTLTQAQTALGNWKVAKKSADDKVAALQNALADADPAALKKAQDALATAQQVLTSAQQKAQQSAKANTDAQAALTTAKAQLKSAEEALTVAQNHHADTQMALTKAQDALVAAQKTLHDQEAVHGDGNVTPGKQLDAQKYAGKVKIEPLNITVDNSVPEPTLVNYVAKAVQPVANRSALVLAAAHADTDDLPTLPAGTHAEWLNTSKVNSDARHVGNYSEDVLVVFPDHSTMILAAQLNVNGIHQNSGSSTDNHGSNTNEPTNSSSSQSSDNAENPDNTSSTTSSTSNLNVNVAGHEVINNAGAESNTTSSLNRSFTNHNSAVVTVNAAQLVSTSKQYKTQQTKQNADTDTLPQTGNSTNDAGLLGGLLLVGLTMFGFDVKRKF